MPASNHQAIMRKSLKEGRPQYNNSVRSVLSADSTQNSSSTILLNSLV
ncbi:hypothetical protein PROFUN_12196 [Planoprotostelium fungivorum]|uniref:Uncharacterized protein n=1 Tax=Planoprotostelium fungivorum TaxID=1890364 RepID=A0A2P6N8G6_9EUKA|nr:hypothetical protein PROFUN_12196 [Planoprotostelium fungivorum]